MLRTIVTRCSRACRRTIDWSPAPTGAPRVVHLPFRDDREQLEDAWDLELLTVWLAPARLNPVCIESIGTPGLLPRLTGLGDARDGPGV